MSLSETGGRKTDSRVHPDRGSALVVFSVTSSWSGIEIWDEVWVFSRNSPSLYDFAAAMSRCDRHMDLSDCHGTDVDPIRNHRGLEELVDTSLGHRLRNFWVFFPPCPVLIPVFVCHLTVQ